MRVGVVILPEQRWVEAAQVWRAAEQFGFDSAWTYDHLWWRSLSDRPWFATFPVLTAAASVTSRIQLGTLVTSPNFRHPVAVAKEAMTVDDVSDGRFTLGIGAGAATDDETATGGRAPDRRTRSDRFSEFVGVVDRLLRQPTTSHSGRFYTVVDAHMVPGCRRPPRLPLAIAAAGPRSLGLAASHGQAWVTYGPADWHTRLTAAERLAAVGRQHRLLERACCQLGRAIDDIDRMFLVTNGEERPLSSPQALLDLAEQYRAVGMTHLVVHWPRPEGVYAGDLAMLDRVAAEALPKVRRL